MNIDKRPKDTEDITCGQCGKANGNEQVGTSWICADCKVTEDTAKEETVTLDNE